MKTKLIILISLMVIAAVVIILFSFNPKKESFKDWAKTPPMGWNSWDCYGSTVVEKEVKNNANYMAQNLKEYGWEYVVVDVRWYVENPKFRGYNQTNPIYVLDEYGRYLPATNRFPSATDQKGFKNLADYIHSLGLKFGINFMRGIPKTAVEQKLPIKGTNGITADQIYTLDNQCTWLKDNYTIMADKPGAQEYYNSIFELYAEWGVDFVKVGDLSAPLYNKDELELIRKAIDNCGRKIVLSTSPGETPIEMGEHVAEHANMWRMVNNVGDAWWHMDHMINISQDWYNYINMGTWPDCDLIPLGRLAIRGEVGGDRMSNLTQEEQYSLMTFYTIFKSPLFFGGDLPSNDEFTLSLLTNKEVLKMHAESSEVKQLYRDGSKLVITSKNQLEDCTYIAMFNISDNTNLDIDVELVDLGINNTIEIIDMWKGDKLGRFKTFFSKNLKPHESKLYKLK